MIQQYDVCKVNDYTQKCTELSLGLIDETYLKIKKCQYYINTKEF